MSGCVNYWTRHTQMQYHRYPKQCYNMVRNLDNVGRVTGASHIRQLLFHTRFGYAWIANGVGSIPVFPEMQFLLVCPLCNSLRKE